MTAPHDQSRAGRAGRPPHTGVGSGLDADVGLRAKAGKVPVPEVPVSCVLRAGSESFDVDAFLRESSWKPDAVFHRGDKRTPTSLRATRFSGFNLELSRGAFEDFDRAVTDAIAFLERDRAEVSRLSALVGASRITLDFAVEYDREKHPFFGRTFPLSIIQAAATAGAKLSLSFYPRSHERDEPVGR